MPWNAWCEKVSSATAVAATAGHAGPAPFGCSRRRSCRASHSHYKRGILEPLLPMQTNANNPTSGTGQGITQCRCWRASAAPARDAEVKGGAMPSLSEDAMQLWPNFAHPVSEKGFQCGCWQPGALQPITSERERWCNYCSRSRPIQRGANKARQSEKQYGVGD